MNNNYLRRILCHNSFKIIISLSILLSITSAAIAKYTPLKDMGVLNEKLIIRGNYAFAPFESLNEKGEMVGFNVDLMKAIMKVLNCKYEIKMQNLDKSIKEAKEGKIDVIMGLSFDTERNKTFSYGIPICYINRKIVSLKNNPINNKEGLRGKRISIQEAGWAREFLKKEKLTNHIVYAKDMKHCLKLLVEGKVDAVIASDYASFYEEKYNDFQGLNHADLGVPPQAYSYAVTRGNEEILFRLNEALQVLKSNGEYDNIYNKWFGVYEERAHQLIVYLLSIFCTILFIGAIYILYRLRRQTKRTRRKLKDSYEQLQLALDAGNISVWIYNIEEGNVRFLSHKDYKKEGISIEEFLGYVDNEYRDRIDKLLASIKNKEISLGEERFKHRVDSEHPNTYYETKVKLIEANVVHPDMIIGTLKNITKDVLEQHRLIQMKEKAEKDNMLKSAFLANMSHDIRTPLGAIAGFNEVLNGDDRYDITDEERKLYLKMIYTNIEIVSTLVNEILDLAKFESGTYIVKLSETNVDEICRTALENVRSQVKQDVELKYTPSKKDLIINTDSVRLQQVITNYLTNACKYTTKGEIELSFIETDDRVIFSVRDTGCGIKPEDAEVCFDRFKMLNNHKNGTGLGLHICKLIANMLKGNVYVDLSYTMGSKFVFELPK